MLFVATTINYMDRQVLSILKPVLSGSVLHLQPFFHGWPTVERSISMNEIQYGNIVWCFQIAYALGVIFAGRLVDRLGCRRGYPIVTAVWSLSAMGHALVTSVFGFGVARFFLGLGESGNFPAAIKATAEWFPPKERALATGIFNSGAGVGAILAPFIVPWVALHFGWRAAFLVTGVFSAIWIVWWSVRYRKPQNLPDLNRGEAVAAAAAPAIPWWRLLRYRQAWAFILGKFLTDPVWWFYLFWLPGYFSKEFKLDLSHIGLPLDRGVCLLDDWQCIWWLAAEGICTPGNVPESCAPGGNADVRLPGRAYRICRRTALDMDCRCAVVYGNQRAPGLVGQHLHDSVGYVSARSMSARWSASARWAARSAERSSRRWLDTSCSSRGVMRCYLCIRVPLTSLHLCC